MDRLVTRASRAPVEVAFHNAEATAYATMELTGMDNAPATLTYEPKGWALTRVLGATRACPTIFTARSVRHVRCFKR